MEEIDSKIESLETWLSGKPYWEKYVWKISLEKDSLTAEDIDQCYYYLSEHLGLIEPIPAKRIPISFKNEITFRPEIESVPAKIQIGEIKDFKGVNAISETCSIKVHPSLTLIYGGNGSGKSGVGRLLCKTCFSRGDREILPDVKTPSASVSQVKATFVMIDSVGNKSEISYCLGDNYNDLKRFSVFDSKSVLIHLDQSNSVNFTPAQIKIFDRVAETISKIEKKLTEERNARKKENPFQVMFLDNATTTTAIFCKGISGSTKPADFLMHANFDLESDEKEMGELIAKVDEKKKLDIPKKKIQLAADRQNLEALKTSLRHVTDCFTAEKMQEANQLVRDTLEKKDIVASLSIASFNDGILNTIGSTEWKSLIAAAKILYESEKAACESKEPEHCMLCHQKLTQDANTLFQKYWEFLESKAESELVELNRKHFGLLRDLKSIKTMYPKFLPTDAGVSVLNNEVPSYLDELKTQFNRLSDILDIWIKNIENLESVDCNSMPTIDLTKIDTLVTSKTTEEGTLIDPSEEITKLTASLNSLKHKKEATSVKDSALEYIAFLKWSNKASGVNFSGIKMATTKKRTESFLVGVAKDYKGVFNQELANLGYDFNLIMHTSGEQGNTVKEYRLNLAENYNPSQILSEGEQKACSLADFLTEVQLDKNNCGIIFDDPVTSLDHERKDKIAKRLVIEAGQRQVIVFTHDPVFMSQMVKHADKYKMPFYAHWMRRVNGVPGYVEDNTSPKLSTLATLKKDSEDAVKDYDLLRPKEQERALGAGLDYLRSASEALIEEVLFAGTIQRYNDHIRVQNLEEVVFDQGLATKVVNFHSRISGYLLAHNRSDLQRENPPGLPILTEFRQEFDVLEKELRESQKAAKKAREARKENSVSVKVGWVV